MNELVKSEKFLQKLGSIIENKIKNEFGRRLGFALLIFDFDNPGVGTYISNAERVCMVKALRETAGRLEVSQEISTTIGTIQ